LDGINIVDVSISAD